MQYLPILKYAIWVVATVYLFANWGRFCACCRGMARLDFAIFSFCVICAADQFCEYLHLSYTPAWGWIAAGVAYIFGYAAAWSMIEAAKEAQAEEADSQNVAQPVHHAETVILKRSHAQNAHLN